jgi:hypothetical protein
MAVMEEREMKELPPVRWRRKGIAWGAVLEHAAASSTPCVTSMVPESVAVTDVVERAGAVSEPLSAHWPLSSVGATSSAGVALADAGSPVTTSATAIVTAPSA